MKNKLFKLVIAIFFFAAVLAFGYAGFFVYKINSLSKKVTLDPPQNQKSSLLDTFKDLSRRDQENLRGQSSGRINVLLLGIAGAGKPGQNLTDTIILASLNIKTSQIALLSLPRDLFVTIPESQIQTKINSVYQISLKSDPLPENSLSDIKKIIQEITSQSVDYYAILNFDGFEKAIDAVGGVNITNERDIYDATYPGPNYSYETFELKKGFHQLNGKTALKYARERHNDPQGDFGRAKRQQQIMEAFKNKVFSSGIVLNAFAMNDLLNTLGDNVKTDIRTDEIESFLELIKKLDTQNINNVVLDAWSQTSLLKVSHATFGEKTAFVLIPRVGNYSEIQELSKNIFDLGKIQRRKEEIAKEETVLALKNQSGDPVITQKIQKLLRDNFGYKRVDILSDKKTTLSEKTTIFDQTDGTKPFTLDELVVKLPASVSYEIPPDWKTTMEDESYDMLIVIGKDLISRYNMEEDSFEDYRNSKDANEYTEMLIDKNSRKD